MGELPCDTILTFTAKYEWCPGSTNLFTIVTAFFNKSLTFLFCFYLLLLYSFTCYLSKFVFVFVIQGFPSKTAKERWFKCINIGVSQTLKDVRLDPTLYKSVSSWISLELQFYASRGFCPINKKNPTHNFAAMHSEPLLTIKMVLTSFNGRL